MVRTVLIASLALVYAHPAWGATDRTVLRDSQAVTTAMGVETLCVPRWQSFLRAYGSKEDAPGLIFEIFGASDLTEFAFPEDSCRSVVASGGYEDWNVAISLYYMAEFLTMTSDAPDTICTDVKNFAKLRKSFHIRRSVTISDYFPAPDCRRRAFARP